MGICVVWAKNFGYQYLIKISRVASSLWTSPSGSNGYLCLDVFTVSTVVVKGNCDNHLDVTPSTHRLVNDFLIASFEMLSKAPSIFRNLYYTFFNYSFVPTSWIWPVSSSNTVSMLDVCICDIIMLLKLHFGIPYSAIFEN